MLISVKVESWPGIAPSGPIWRPEFGSLVVSSHRWQSEFRRISASENVSSEHNNNRSPESTSWLLRRFEFFHYFGFRVISFLMIVLSLEIEVVCWRIGVRSRSSKIIDRGKQSIMNCMRYESKTSLEWTYCFYKI